MGKEQLFCLQSSSVLHLFCFQNTNILSEITYRCVFVWCHFILFGVKKPHCNNESAAVMGVCETIKT